MVSSRDVGRYLKTISISGTSTLLEDLKYGQGGLKHFVQEVVPDLFAVVNRDHGENQNRDPRDKSYWILLKDGALKTLLQQVKATVFTLEEREFLANYSLPVIERGDNDNLYYHTTLETDDFNFRSPTEYLGDGDLHNSNITKRNILILTPDLISDCTTWTLEHLKEYFREKNLCISATKSLKAEKCNNDSKEKLKLRNLFLNVNREKEHLRNVLNILEQQKTRQSLGTKRILQRPYRNIDNRIPDYLSNLVKEYITVNGGNASSRDIGRYLASNSASSKESLTALKELKDNYGGLANFLNRENKFLIKNCDGDGSDYAFSVSLKES